MKKWILTLLAAIFLVGSVQSAQASKAGTYVECEPVSVEIELTKWLSLEFNTGIEVCEIVTYRKKDMRYGDMAIAYGMAAESGRSVADILAMRYEEKMGWGKIGKILGVKVSDAVHRASGVLERSNLYEEREIIILYTDEDEDEHGKGDKQTPPGHANHKKKHGH